MAGERQGSTELLAETPPSRSADGGLDEVRLERFKTARLRNRTEQAVQTRLGPPVRLESSTLDLARGGVVKGGPVGPCACPSATLSAIAPAPGSARRASSAVVGHRPEHKRAFSRIASGDWSRLAADHGDAYRLHRLRGERVKFTNRPRQNSGSVLGSWLPAAVAQALAL